MVDRNHPLRPAAAHGPLADPETVYATPDGRRCIVTFANRGTDALSPVRNDRGELWVGFLLPDGHQPERFDDWDRAWVPAELLRPLAPPGAGGVRPD